jgi:uncharacterized protein YutE (UPF0331/DUF86 family)
MSDARWADVEDDIKNASVHFIMATRLFDAGGLAPFDPEGMAELQDIESYKSKMAILHAMQSAHTSLEAALKRILQILGEEEPTGDQSHADLIKRVRKAITMPGRERPAILPDDVAQDADETRRFRHSAAHDYNNFDPSRATPSIDAARRLGQKLKLSIDEFRAVVDPSPSGWKND